MNFFSKLFGHNKTAKPEAQPDAKPDAAAEIVPHQAKAVPISSVSSCAIPEGSSILSQSEIPASCSIGNLIFEKKYAEAIQMGLDLLKQTPNDPGVHINLMEAYFKSRESNPDYFDKSTHHAKLAMLCGHHTGLAEDRLAKNLDKCKLFHQSLQLYNLILDNPGFHFSSHGMGNGIDFNKRREFILKKMDKAADTEADILFTTDEIARIILSVRDNDAAEEAERKASEERIALFKKKADDAEKEIRKYLDNI